MMGAAGAPPFGGLDPNSDGHCWTHIDVSDLATHYRIQVNRICQRCTKSGHGSRRPAEWAPQSKSG